MIFCCVIVAYSQPVPDSIKAKYNAAKTDEEKGRLLFSYFPRPTSTDSATIANTIKLLSWFKEHNDIVSADYTELNLSLILLFRGNYDVALKQGLALLSRFQKRKDDYGVMQANRMIGDAYSFSRNPQTGIEYLRKSVAMAEVIDPRIFLSNAYNDLGLAYWHANMPDSGIIYAQKALNLDMENRNEERIAVSLSTVAENYMALGENDLGISFLRKSVNYHLAKKGQKNNYSFAFVYNDFAQAYLDMKQYDSVNFYAHKSLAVSTSFGYPAQALRSYEYLYKSFEATNKQDSVNAYFRLAMAAKDSLYSLEKVRGMEAMGFQEQLRQQEAETEKQKADEERKQNIQYALIALGIIALVTMFLLLSRSFITNTKLIKFFGVIALLIVFEFLNLLLHPFLESITHHSPVLMLLALVCIAALLVPLHHKLEHWSTTKLVEKNKKIRLAAAKKTIQELEDNS